MIRPQFTLDLHEELIIDNFAGGGGASTGIELALGRCVDHAINHDRFALGMHRINHPQTVHHCEDIFDVDPATVCEGRPVGLCHNSPDCKHFSKAKGGQPLSKRIRGLVLVMLKWAKYGARVLTMENVEEIETWGPLIWMKKNGKWGWFPDPLYKGRTWQAFLAILSTGIDAEHPDLPEILEVLGGYLTKEDCVRGLGYVFEVRKIRACDLGTPTIRKRLYMIARCDGRPIVWPAASHAEKGSPLLRGAGRLKPYRAIAECIEWHLPCPSIFLNKQQARRARCKRPLAKSTLRRIAKGVDRYVLKAKKPFIVSLTHAGGDRVESIDDPSRTVTGAHRGEKGLVAPVVSRYQGDHAGREDGTERNLPLTDPLSTQDTSNRFGLSEATLAPFVTEHANASHQRNFPADEPARTTCAEIKGGHFAMVSGTLVHTAHGEQDQNGRKRGRGAHSLTDQMPSALGSSDCALAATALVKMRGEPETHAPGHHPAEPGHTISAGGSHHGLMAAHLTKFCTGSVGQDLRGPGPTITAGSHSPDTHGGAAVPQGLIAAYLAQHNGGFNETPGHPATGPARTISGTGSQQQLVTAHLGKWYSTDQDPRLDAPGHTVTTKDRFSLEESVGVDCVMTPDQIAGARRVAAFLREYGVEFEGEFATVEGYVIVDLGMRMLTPRELFRAQGFSDSYIIDRAWVIDPTNGALEEITLTKEQQIRMCGNSVCPPVMRAIIRENVPELMAWQKGDRRRLEVAS